MKESKDFEDGKCVIISVITRLKSARKIICTVGNSKG